MTTDRQVPPQAIESEMSILGAIFVENEAIDTVAAIIKADDLYRISHRHIYAAMCALHDSNQPIDTVTLSAKLKGAGVLEEVGGAGYLAVLVDFVPMAANVAYYCKEVAQKATERRILAGAADAARIIYAGGELSEAVTVIETAIQPVVGVQATEPVSMAASLKEAATRIEKRHESRGEIQGIPYGIAELDAATSGMHPGELIVIAGRPSMGKTALALNVLGNVGATGRAGMLFSLEMSRGDNVDRMASSRGIKYQNIRSGQLSELEWMKLTKCFGEMHNWKLMIDDTPAISLREIRAKARRQKRDGLDLIVIDYLQLMSVTDPRASRVQGIGEISRGLKHLARELGVPVIALSQLSREVDKRMDKRPVMSDLRDSGEIEQDADVIIFPYRPAVYCDKCRDRVESSDHSYKEHQAKAEIIIEKQRAGERNLSVPACWIGQYQRFDSV